MLAFEVARGLLKAPPADWGPCTSHASPLGTLRPPEVDGNLRGTACPLGGVQLLQQDSEHEQEADAGVTASMPSLSSQLASYCMPPEMHLCVALYDSVLTLLKSVCVLLLSHLTQA